MIHKPVHYALGFDSRQKFRFGRAAVNRANPQVLAVGRMLVLLYRHFRNQNRTRLEPISAALDDFARETFVSVGPMKQMIGTGQAIVFAAIAATAGENEVEGAGVRKPCVRQKVIRMTA